MITARRSFLPPPGARGSVPPPQRGVPAIPRPERAEHRHPLNRPVAVALLLLLTLAPGPTWAQTIQGTVLDAASGIPISMADVTVLTMDGSLVGRGASDANGRFALRVPAAGSYRLRAARIGYSPATTSILIHDIGQDAVVELRLQPDPVPLDPIEAVAERQRRLDREGFYERQAKGIGYFLTPEELEALHPVFLEDLFWNMGGVGMRGDAVMSFRSFRPCALRVAIDGTLVDTSATWTELVHVDDIEAIEVYPSPIGVPVWLSGPVSFCGALVIWTKGSLP